MAQTLLLDTISWDLVVDINGNIAVAAEPYSLAQDAASACKLFQGELWYDTTQGIPYFQSILGKAPPVALMKTKFIAAAESVPDVASAQAFISAITRHRQIAGQVQITSDSGAQASLNFTQPVYNPSAFNPAAAVVNVLPGGPPAPGTIQTPL